MYDVTWPEVNGAEVAPLWILDMNTDQLRRSIYRSRNTCSTPVTLLPSCKVRVSTSATKEVQYSTTKVAKNHDFT